MTSKNYGSLDVSYLSANGYFYVEYSGAENELELILQSWSEEQVGQEFSLAKQAERMIITILSSHMQTVYKELGAGFEAGSASCAKNGDITVYSICILYTC